MFKKFGLILLILLMFVIPMFGGSPPENNDGNKNENDNSNINTNKVIVPVTNTNIDLNTNINKPVFINNPISINAPKANSNAEADAKANAASSSNSSSSSKVENDVKNANVLVNEGNKSKIDVENKNNVKQDQSINFAPVTINEKEYPNAGPAINASNFVGMPQEPTKGFGDIGFETFLKLQDRFNGEQLLAMKERGPWERSPVFKTHKILDSSVEVSMVRFTYSIDKNKSKLLYIVSVQHKSKIGESLQLLGWVGDFAKTHGGNTVLIIAEGTKKSIRAWSFGTGGFSTSARQVPGDPEGTISGGNSGVGVGGTDVLEKPWAVFAIYSCAD